MTEPEPAITLSQLRDFRESLEAGRLDEIFEWLDGAIRLIEGEGWDEILEEKEI